MERIPFPGTDDPYETNSYYAHSLADMIDDESEFFQASSEQYQAWKAALPGLQRVGETIYRAVSRSVTPHRFPALVHVSAVRHYPQEDIPEHSSRINLTDSVVTQSVELPQTGRARIYARTFAQQTGIPFDPLDLKERFWSSDVILYNEYAATQTKYSLVHVRNLSAGQSYRKPEPIYFGGRQPSFA